MLRYTTAATLAGLALLSGVALSKPATKPMVNTGSYQLIMQTMATSYGGTTNVMRTMGASYMSPQTAPAGASANLAVPPGLGLVSPVPYQIQNLQAQGGKAEYEMLHYWQSSPTVPKGQPENFKGKVDTTGQKWVGGSSGLPDATKMKYLKENQFMFDESSRVAGPYHLKISYVGDIHIDMTDKQQFLAPLQVTKPEAPASVDTSQSIEVTWDHVPNAVGYTVFASGKNAAGKSVYWENAYQAQTAVYTGGAAGALKAGKLVPPDKTRVQIHAGIFKGPVTLMITGYSPEVKGKGPLNPWGWAQTLTSMQVGQ
jgi:hypothetical protein